jgi:SAM-dependent methyltransferase
MQWEGGALRATYDTEALLYDQIRPGYPEEVYEDIIALADVPSAGRILEIGCGTGQATLPLAQRGYRLFCIELGANLAEVARQKLSAYPEVEIWTGTFEDWPVEAEAFDLAVSATAFHWIDPAIGYPKVAQALRPGGSIAFFWNLHVYSDANPAFFEAAQVIYERETPEIFDNHDPPPRWEEVETPIADQIAASQHFGEVTVRRYFWEVTYDSASYLRLLNTYSGHRNLTEAKRERLFDGIAGLIDTQFGGRITKGYLTILYVARRL